MFLHCRDAKTSVKSSRTAKGSLGSPTRPPCLDMSLAAVHSSQGLVILRFLAQPASRPIWKCRMSARGLAGAWALRSSQTRCFPKPKTAKPCVRGSNVATNSPAMQTGRQTSNCAPSIQTPQRVSFRRLLLSLEAIGVGAEQWRPSPLILAVKTSQTFLEETVLVLPRVQGTLSPFCRVHLPLWLFVVDITLATQ